VTTTSDMKTVVPQPMMRQQADFHLGDALRRVPGIGRR
jgi:outer membrane receptor for monomeric catechols